MRAGLAHVRLHEPAKASRTVAVHMKRLLLLDKGDVPPRVRVQLAGVVVGAAEPILAVLRDQVPFLARNFACLAADADRRVGEEPDARMLLVLPRLVPGGDAGRVHQRAHAVDLELSGSSRGAASRREYA